MQEQKFSVGSAGDYIHLKTWGRLEMHDLEAPANAAIELAKKEGVTKLLDDIREIDSSFVSLPIQAKAAGILWKLRFFDKVAIVTKDKEVSWLLLRMLEEIHLNQTFKGFSDEAEAVKWLRSQ